MSSEKISDEQEIAHVGREVKVRKRPLSRLSSLVLGAL